MSTTHPVPSALMTVEGSLSAAINTGWGIPGTTTSCSSSSSTSSTSSSSVPPVVPHPGRRNSCPVRSESHWQLGPRAAAGGDAGAGRGPDSASSLGQPDRAQARERESEAEAAWPVARAPQSVATYAPPAQPRLSG
eukprot:3556410-Rhodomonas_salina.1